MGTTTKFFISAFVAMTVLSACGDKAVDPAANNLSGTATGTGTGGGAPGGGLGNLGGGGALDMGVNKDSMGSTISALNSQAGQAKEAGNAPLADAYKSGAGYVGDLIGAYQQLAQQAPNLNAGGATSLDNQFTRLAQQALHLSDLFDSLGMQAMADLFRKMAFRKNIWAVVKPADIGSPRKDAVAANLMEIIQFMQYGYRLAGGAFVTYNVQTAAALPFLMVKLTRCFEPAKTVFFVTKEASCPSGSIGAKVLGYIASDQDGGALPLKEMRIEQTGNLADSANSITTASSRQQKALKALGYQETSLGYVF